MARAARISRIGAIVGVVVLLVTAAAGAMAYDYTRDVAQSFDDPVKQFEYGSTGGDRLAGIPVGIFKALPEICRKYLPGEGLQSLGFIYEPGMDRPVGTSLRHSLGFDRISLNCAACHTGTWRSAAGSPHVVVPGMPANRLYVGGFITFLTNCALDENFNPWQVMQAAEHQGEHYNFYQRMLLQYVAVPAMKEGLVLARYRFRFTDHEPAFGPGRVDTFGPEKALLNWPFEQLPPGEMVGVVDLPSLWLQGPRVQAGMHLHWDGNNTSVAERNRSAAFGTGAVPTVADRPSLQRIADFLVSPANHPPKYPFPIDGAVAARGKQVYGEYCANCHGVSGQDFSGAKVGQVDPIEHVRTDPCRLDNYTAVLTQEQGNIYAAYPDERFSHFRKTQGYANMPLDGVWLRAPYLHNGSVPTLRDLLEPSDKRPAFFWRGNDIVDQARLGFVSTAPSENGAAYFRYNTRCTDTAEACALQANPANDHAANVCVAGPWAGNSNTGHEGREYGTELPDGDKAAIVEYLKTF
jgi:mono/diheme cytochrome c family protein